MGQLEKNALCALYKDTKSITNNSITILDNNYPIQGLKSGWIASSKERATKWIRHAAIGSFRESILPEFNNSAR
jgi:hypothetical protein